MIRTILAGASVVLLAASALSTAAQAADLTEWRPAQRAPARAEPVSDWTGLYIGGGGGYGMWDHEVSSLGGGDPISTSVNGGGKGYFATASAGFDGQFAGRFVIGIFADYDLSDIKGDTLLPTLFVAAPEKQTWAWAAGARVGYLVTPSILSYVTGGYTQAHFAQATTHPVKTIPDQDPVTETFLPSHTYSGWFLGGGAEAMVSPGWFMRTEYRYADYRVDNITIYQTATGLSDGTAINSHRSVQTIRSELTYKFNWSRGLVSRY
jgi:outer membrane immunogenic protein